MTVVPVVPDRRAHRHAKTERDDIGGGITWRIPVAWRIAVDGIVIAGWRPSRAIDYGWTIGRDIDDLGSGLDDDDLFLHHHLLFLGGFEVAAVVGVAAHALYRIHHLLLLGEHGVTQVLGPIQVVAHPFQHIWKVGQRLDARIPFLRGQGIFQRLGFQTRILLDPTGGLYDLQWIGGRHQYLGDQTIRIDGDRRHQLLDLRLSEGPRGRGGLCRRGFG